LPGFDLYDQGLREWLTYDSVLVIAPELREQENLVGRIG
jgi:hypothetical protein